MESGNKPKKAISSRITAVQQALYSEMEKSGAPPEAVEAFRRRPYSLGGARRETNAKI